jgi:AraC family transcriptional regulator
MNEPRIVDKAGMIIAGMVFYGDPFKSEKGWSQQNEIGKLWGRFISFMDKKGNLVKNQSNTDAGFEIHIEGDEYKETKEYYLMVGAELTKVEDLPPEIFVKVFPPTKYAIFTLKGKEITSNWSDEIYMKWLPGSGYVEAYKYLFEYYDKRFKGMDKIEASELDIWVPIKKAS